MTKLLSFAYDLLFKAIPSIVGWMREMTAAARRADRDRAIDEAFRPSPPPAPAPAAPDSPTGVQDAGSGPRG